MTEEERSTMTNIYYEQLNKHHMRLFSVVIDKKVLKEGFSSEQLHHKAYELLLERIRSFIKKEHPKHKGIIVIDSVSKQADFSLATQHSALQKYGNIHTDFKNIVECPMFTDSSLCTGIQLADLCCYNVYRAFRRREFDYTYFQKILPRFHRPYQNPSEKLAGLKVWPNQSELIEWAHQSYLAHKTKQPTLWDNL